MAAIEVFAPAKINLALHVTGQRADGYHLLDSLVVFADVGDRLTVRPVGGPSLSVSGPMSSGVPTDGRNLVLRAAAAMGVPATITLEKHLPAAAGIGGGSSDAAAVMRALAGTGAPLPDAPEALGADVPVCLFGRPARMSGIGERIQPADGLPPLPAVLVNPGVSVSTPEVFRALKRRDGAPMPAIPGFADVGAYADWLAAQRNDLEAPAVALAPVIGAALDALDACGALLARMSGSGATCFGLFASDRAARRAADRISASEPGWWVHPTMLAGS